jgi:uncharacterized RDD family membrane protein YckC
MAKWRDVKKGRVLSKKEASTSSKTSAAISASIASRLKAFLTDTFLITTPIFYVVIYFIMDGGEDFAQNRTLGWTLIFLMHALIILFFWLKNAQTPGLKAYGIKLISTSTQQKITFFQALLRYAVTLIAVICFPLLFIAFLRKDKRTFQDIISDSHIVLE